MTNIRSFPPFPHYRKGYRRSFFPCCFGTDIPSSQYRSYYVGLQHKGQLVALLVNAPGRCFEVWEGRSLLKRLPIKGLQGAPMPLERFIAWMREQAIAEERRGKFQTRAFGWRQLLLWDNASA